VVSVNRFPNGETVTVTPRTLTGQDDSGNDQYSDGTPVDVRGCPVWPRTTAETLAQLSDAVSEGLAVLVPAGTVVDAYSRVRVRGLDYQVTGDPQVYRSALTGTAIGTLLQLDRVTG
jgi:hypothetical protein